MVESRKPLKRGSGDAARGIARLVAFVGGIVLIVAGVAAGVTMVLLPLGIPAGLIGLFLVLGALFPDSLSHQGG